MCPGPQGGAPSPRTQTTSHQSAQGATASKPGVLGPAPTVLLLLTTQYQALENPPWLRRYRPRALALFRVPTSELPGGLRRQARLPERGWDPALRITPVQPSPPPGAVHGRPQPASRQDKTRDSQPPPAADSLPPREPGWVVHPPSTHPTATRTPPRRELSSATSETPDPPRKAGPGPGRPRGQAGAGTSQAPPQQPGAAGGDALKGTAAPPPDAVFFRRAVASAPLGPVQVAPGPARPPPLRGTKGQGALQPGPARPQETPAGHRRPRQPARCGRGRGARAEGEGRRPRQRHRPGPRSAAPPPCGRGRGAAWSPRARRAAWARQSLRAGRRRGPSRR